MKRYFRIYKILIKLNFANQIAYRANLLNSLVANFAWSAFGIISMLLLTSKTSNVFGWTREELLVLAGCYHLVMSVFYIIFARNFQQFADTIYFGKLDAILTKPIDAQFMLSAMQIGFSSFIRLIMGIIFLAYIFMQAHLHITVLSFISFAILLLLSVSILYSIWYSVLTITIWHGKLNNLIDLLYAVNSILRNPGDLYRGASIGLYIILFPFMVILTNPVKALLNKVAIGDLLIPFVLAISLGVFCRMFWKFALRNYTSASG